MSRTSFNADWSVKPKTSIFAQLGGVGVPPQPVTLPHDALVFEPRTTSGEGKSAYFPVRSAYEYHKTFTVPSAWRDKHVRVEFEGAYRDAMVFVNGQFAAQWRYGYSQFDVTLDEHLAPGELNTIRVDTRAHDDSRWYTGNGLHRDVFLVVTDPVHVAPEGPAITTPDVDDDRAVVEVLVPVRNLTRVAAQIRAEVVIRDADGTAVAWSASPVTVRAGRTALSRQRMYLPHARRWSVEDPHLYQVEVKLRRDDAVIDDWDGVLGVRTLQLDPAYGLRINGETIKLRGACIHHDNGLLGAAAIGRAEYRRIELLKEAGFNAIRSAHNPASRAMLEACDRLGMLVMDETFDVWTEGKSTFDYSLDFPEWWERDVEAMVRKDRNHPSVIFYSIGNEIPETGTPLGAEWSRRLAEKVHELDSTRFVTNGINGFISVLPDVAMLMRERVAEAAAAAEGGVNAAMNSAGDMMNQISASPLVTEKTEEAFATLDVAGLNYGDGRYTLDKETFPQRIIVGTETYPTVIDRNWKLVTDNPHVIGDFTWAGWDYLGEVGAGRLRYEGEPAGSFEGPFPWLTGWVGDHDITGHRRPQSYYREIVFGLREDPYIAVQRPSEYHRVSLPGQWSWLDALASWSWEAPEGDPVKIEVYSAADEVELFINGRSIGRRPAGPGHRYRATFDTAYQPGRVTAVAYTDGKESGRHELLSADSTATLSATTDRELVVADHNDLAFVTIELVDGDGLFNTAAEREITVTVDGAGALRALGTGRPTATEPFHSPTCTTFDGRALAIVRPTEAGQITVTVTADGMADAVVHIQAHEPGTAGVSARTRAGEMA